MSPFECNHDGSCEIIKACCVDTEMTVTRKDADRITSLEYKRKDFLQRTSDGFCELKNIEGYCFFYDRDSKLCNIYDNRPEGCRFYPIVYDMRKRKCVVDKDCPSRETVTRQEVRKVCHKVRRLVEQLVQEASHGESPC